MPDDDAEDDDLLLTFGRGLGIVARCSTAWGVDLEAEGKTIWFTPATGPCGDLVVGVVTGERPASPHVPAPDEMRIDIVGVSLPMFTEFQRHYRELRREVRLLSLAHESDYPLAKELSELYSTLERELREGFGADQVERAWASGAATSDLRVSMPRHSAATIERFVDLLDLADAFCREKRLLSLARVPEQQRFQRWFFSEFVRQGRGGDPVAWQDAPVSLAENPSSVT
jgi:hypothetical protein